MDTLEIQENVNGMIIIHHTPTDRYFKFDFPKKFNSYGFGGLNTQEVLLPRLIAKDFAFYLSNTKINIWMMLTNGARTYKFETECEEIFPDQWINLDINGLNPNVLMYLKSLQNRINNLSNKLEEFKEKVEELENKNNQYYEY
jgi:hypothetical protein